ncbi:VWA domain-containing protein [Christiangramia sp.]|uniref:VWA domain-containing protein n=1 Tax=Christiangramia sp. TaxID=1931228 RepID=UPI002605C197|nr:VWA domain-containing protein [Christiangramia sp.]
MKTRHQVHNLIILDESGSMFSIKDQIIRGFNEIVQTIKGVENKYSEQEHFISFLTFNGLGITEHLFNQAVRNLKQIDNECYRPGASTPLYDAIGYGVSKLEKIIGNKRDSNVLVTVFTDGEENASREYSREVIKNKIEQLKHRGWTFTYTGTDHDVYSAASALSIKNVVKFERNEADMEKMFLDEREARMNYSAYIRSGKDIGDKFYKRDLE